MLTTNAKTLPAPINPAEYLTDADLLEMQPGFSHLPSGWFALEPELVTGADSSDTGICRYAKLLQVAGPSVADELCIWREGAGFIVSHCSGGLFAELPMVGTMGEAMQAVGAHVTAKLAGWGVKLAA